MLLIQQIHLPIDYSEEQLTAKICQALKIKIDVIRSWQIVKKSIDARKKQELHYVLSVEVETTLSEKDISRLVKAQNISISTKSVYQFEVSGSQSLKNRPVIIGSGPAGLFCGYLLAEAGFAPLIIERGKTVADRKKDVQKFWDTGILNTESNVQFGEGGAGTFSDGKLNTLVKDPAGRNRKVLEIFCRHGAPAEIMYESKPHIGTDILETVIPDMRKYMIERGAEFLFESCLTDIHKCGDQLSALEINHSEIIDADCMVLAIGHSARDTFSMIKDRGLELLAKSFAVGLRVEHPQHIINDNQYGPNFGDRLPAAPYKLTANLPDGRGVYSFCMCPGGHVVNASSELNRLAVNGMSYYKRDSSNANSAIIVSVTPDDFGSEDALAGITFQRKLEEKAFQLGCGKIPQQLFGDFVQKKTSEAYGSYESVSCGNTDFAPLHELLPETLYESFIKGMKEFARKIPGFANDDVILSGIESRTSSPVRISRNEEYVCNIDGIYPCGEGAGYAGGIMSAAMDGMKTAEMIGKKYTPGG